MAARRRKALAQAAPGALANWRGGQVVACAAAPMLAAHAAFAQGAPPQGSVSALAVKELAPTGTLRAAGALKRSNQPDAQVAPAGG